MPLSLIGCSRSTISELRNFTNGVMPSAGRDYEASAQDDWMAR